MGRFQFGSILLTSAGSLLTSVLSPSIFWPQTKSHRGALLQTMNDYNDKEISHQRKNRVGSLEDWLPSLVCWDQRVRKNRRG